MDYKSLTSLMLRLAGVFIVVSAVISAPNTFLSLLYRGRAAESADSLALAAAALAAFAIPLMVGLLLIYFPARIANGLVSSGASTETAGALVLQQMAFSTLGLYFVTVAAYDTFYWWAKLHIYFAVYEEMRFPGPRRLSETDFAGIASTAAQFVAGGVLLFGGRGIANLFHRLRQPLMLPGAGEPPSVQDRPAGHAGT